MFRQSFMLLGVLGVSQGALCADLASLPESGVDSGFQQMMGGFGVPNQPVKVSTTVPGGGQEYHFADGSRLLVKVSNAEEGRVSVRLNLGQGRLGLPAKLASSSWAAAFIPLGGTSVASYKEIENWLQSSGHRVELKFVPLSRSFTFWGTTDSPDVGYQIGLFCGLTRNAGLGEAVEDKLKPAVSGMGTAIDANAGVVFSRGVQRAVSGLGSRYAEIPLRTEINPKTFEDLEKIVAGQFGGPVDIAVVGDVNPDAVARLVGQSCAAGRSAASSRVAVAARPHFSAGQHLWHFNRTASSASTGFDGVYWEVGSMANSVRERLALDVLGEVLKVRLSMKMSGPEHRSVPLVGTSANTDFKGFGFFGVGVNCEDLHGSRAETLVSDELAAMSRDPQMYGQVRAVIASKMGVHVAALKSNDRLAQIFADSLADATQAEDFFGRGSALESLSVDDVRRQALKLLNEKRRAVVEVLPDGRK